MDDDYFISFGVFDHGILFIMCQKFRY